jgi:hypothetical protein
MEDIKTGTIKSDIEIVPKKYRIYRDDEGMFCPQFRKFFIWNYFTKNSCSVIVRYGTLDGALAFIEKGIIPTLHKKEVTK